MALIGEKFIFIHVQKCGGMAIRRALHFIDRSARESGDYQQHRHIALPELLTETPGIDCGRFVFGVVRDPLDWLVSRWRFCVQSGFPVQMRHNPRAARTWMADCWDDDLNQFLENVLQRHPGIATRFMSHMLGLWSARPVDAVLHFDTLEADFAAAMQKAGIACNTLERVNETREKFVRVDHEIAARIRAADEGITRPEDPLACRRTSDATA